MPSFDNASRSPQALTAELARMTQRLAPLAGDHETALPDLRVHRRNEPTEPLHCIFPLGFAPTTQGHKQVLLGEKVFSYGPGESMLTTIDLPVAAHITRATAREPYLGISLAFDATSLARVLTEVASFFHVHSAASFARRFSSIDVHRHATRSPPTFVASICSSDENFVLAASEA
jgi:AraC-type transcriptional regulator N-terminus